MEQEPQEPWRDSAGVLLRGRRCTHLRVLLLVVAYLHAGDIVRRNIKPENILFEEQDSSDAMPTSSVQFTELTRSTS